MHCVKCGAPLPEGAAFCPGCGQKIEESAPGKPATSAQPNPSKMSTGRQSCLIVAGVIFALFIIGTLVTPSTQNGGAGNSLTTGENATATALDLNATAPETAYTSQQTQVSQEEVGRGNLTASQANAARSAEQYLSMTGFSRDGLIHQLSSSAGDGYALSDATAAVDSLDVDWNENAARSAKQYLDISGFSCQGLIEQLSSRAGDKYTVEQATYGARQAGAC